MSIAARKVLNTPTEELDNLYLCDRCFGEVVNSPDDCPDETEEVPIEAGFDCEGYGCKYTAEYFCSWNTSIDGGYTRLETRNLCA